MGATRRLTLAATTLAAVLGACGGSDGPAPPASAPATATTIAGAVVVGSGSVVVPPVRGIQDAPGFHEPYDLAATVPAGLTGRRLEIRFRDVSRPAMTCSSEHPLSGCVTLDWSDFEERPRVPAGGVLDQHVDVPVAGGTTRLYLSETGRINPQPDDYQPG